MFLIALLECMVFDNKDVWTIIKKLSLDGWFCSYLED